MRYPNVTFSTSDLRVFQVAGFDNKPDALRSSRKRFLERGNDTERVLPLHNGAGSRSYREKYMYFPGTRTVPSLLALKPASQELSVPWLQPAYLSQIRTDA